MRLMGADVAVSRADVLLDGVGSELNRYDASAEVLESFTENRGSFTVQNGRDYLLNPGSRTTELTAGAASTVTADGDYVQNVGFTTVIDLILVTQSGPTPRPESPTFPLESMSARKL